MRGAWTSMRRRLPLLVTALVVAAIGATAAIAYREMKASLLRTAQERVLSVSTQVANTLGASNETLARVGSPLARDSAIHAVFVDPSAVHVQSAIERLAADRRADSMLVAVQLLNRSGAAIAAEGRALPHPTPGDAGVSSPVRPMLAFHDTVVTDVWLPVLGAARDTLGYVRKVTRVSSKNSKQLLSGLIGGDAALLIGNRSGDVWTDLHARAAEPTRDFHPDRAIEVVGSDGDEWIGAMAAVPRAPWLVWVAFPETAILAPARHFLWRSLAVDALIMVLAALAAWQISRHVVGPVVDVTHAAEALAAGDLAVRASVHRRDEVGRLGAAFNTMASAIQTSTAELEEQAVELELQSTELEETNEELRHNMEVATRERHVAERARARASAVIDAAYTCIIIVDVDGTITDFNPAAESTFELTAHEARGRRIADLVPSLDPRGTDDAARVIHDMTQPDGRPRVIESTARRASGVVFPTDLAVCRIPTADGMMLGVFLRDLSERVHLQTQLAQARKMEAVGRLAGGVAHDFNNILTVVISYSDLVLGDDAIAATTRADVQLIRQAADRAAALTRQLLAFSRKQVLHPTVLDANDVVGDVFVMLKRVIPSNIDVQIRPAPSLAHIFADRGQIEQVLMNLAVNARDAMPDGGVLAIETSETVLDDAYIALHPGGSPGPHIVISVRDTGYGMDAETRARIFEPFFTTKPPGQGTGLGLATVYGIVQQSGGSVYVYSEPGHGTTFKLYFPIHQGEEPVVAPDVDIVRMPGTPLRILLVEDDATVRAAVFATIERIGHEVRSASNVAAALESLRADPRWPDVVITDAVMPGQSGLELAAILQDERPELPVVVVSGYSEEAVTGGRVSSGVVFLEKPFTAADLGRAIDRARQDRTGTRGAHTALA